MSRFKTIETVNSSIRDSSGRLATGTIEISPISYFEFDNDDGDRITVTPITRKYKVINGKLDPSTPVVLAPTSGANHSHLNLYYNVVHRFGRKATENWQILWAIDAELSTVIEYPEVPLAIVGSLPPIHIVKRADDSGTVNVLQHNQTIPETDWLFVHGLGRYPAAISVIDDSTDPPSLVHGEITFPTINSVNVSVATPMTGIITIL